MAAKFLGTHGSAWNDKFSAYVCFGSLAVILTQIQRVAALGRLANIRKG